MEIVLVTGICIFIMLIFIGLLGAYNLADYNVFFTRVPEGEIIGITYSEKIGRFMGNIDGYWVHPKTGEVFHEKTNPIPSDVSIPSDLFGTGIYWLGIAPFAQRYVYEFHWNKWAKPTDPDTGLEKAEYGVITRQAFVDSIYFKAQYPVQVKGYETKERVPITTTILITVQVHNANTAWFKVKSPGWLPALTGQVMAIQRDWIGQRTMDEINVLQAEIPDSGKHSDFQRAFFTLNDSAVGNQSIKEALGVELVGISFVGYSIDKPTNETQRVSIEEYYAQKRGEAAKEKARLDADAAVETARQTRTEAEAAAFATATKGEGEAKAKVAMATAEAEAIVRTGEAEAKAAKAKGQAIAEAARLLTDATKDNPHYSSVVIAEAIRDQKTATTLLLGAGALPTVPTVNRQP